MDQYDAIPDELRERHAPKFTPGPWDVDGKEIVGRKGRRIITDYGSYEGLVWGDSEKGMPDEEVEANLRLIAAAPEMLEALQEAVACGLVPNSTAIDGGPSRHARQVVVADMIRVAIAKAIRGDHQ